MQLSSFFKASQFWWKYIKASSVSTEYQQWRHRFILERIYLLIWIAVIVCLIGAIVSWTIIFPSLAPNSARYDFYQQNRWLILGNRIIQILALLLTLVLLKAPFARRYPLLILLWLTWTLLLIPQVIVTVFLGQIRLAGFDWITTFSLGPILMPVRWQWHWLCQTVVLGYFGISYLVFGLRDPFVEYEIEYFQVIYSTAIVCLIINLGIFLYERLLQQEFELHRQLRLFLYTVSHDLRNPVLGKIFLLKSLLNSSTEKVEVSQEILTEMLASSDRQLKLIDSLLEAYTTENKGIVLRPRPVRLDTLIESVITEMQPFLERQNTTITLEIPVLLPPVHIDPLQVRRVYENLIANALEHNPPGLHLTLKADLHAPPSIGISEPSSPSTLPNNQTKTNLNQWVYCTVSDNGEGIPSLQRPQLFDLYTGKSSVKQSLNVGLGLYISRQIITAHGGEIGVNSSSTGASFWFTLPHIHQSHR